MSGVNTKRILRDELVIVFSPSVQHIDVHQ